MIFEAPLPTKYPPISPTKQPKDAIKPIKRGINTFNSIKGWLLKHTTKV